MKRLLLLCVVALVSPLSAQIYTATRGVAYEQLTPELIEQREREERETQEQKQERLAKKRDKRREILQFGFKIGSGITTLNIDAFSSYSINSFDREYNYFSPYLGATVNYKLSEKFSLQTELMFKYSNTNSDDLYVEYRDKYGWSSSGATYWRYDEQLIIDAGKNFWIDIPVIAKYKLINRLYVSIGAQLGFGIGSDGTNCASGYDVDMDKDMQITDIKNRYSYESDWTVNKTVFSLVGGVQYYISKSIDFNIRYNHALTNLFSDSVFQPSKTREFQFGFGYTLFRTKDGALMQ